MLDVRPLARELPYAIREAGIKTNCRQSIASPKSSRGSTRKVHFPDEERLVTGISRPPSMAELDALEDYEEHASTCSRCSATDQPMGAGQMTCSKGELLSHDLSSRLVQKHGTLFESVNDGKSRNSIRIELARTAFPLSRRLLADGESRYRTQEAQTLAADRNWFIMSDRSSSSQSRYNISSAGQRSRSRPDRSRLSSVSKSPSRKSDVVEDSSQSASRPRTDSFDLEHELTGRLTPRSKSNADRLVVSAKSWQRTPVFEDGSSDEEESNELPRRSCSTPFSASSRYVGQQSDPSASDERRRRGSSTSNSDRSPSRSYRVNSCARDKSPRPGRYYDEFEYEARDVRPPRRTIDPENIVRPDLFSMTSSQYRPNTDVASRYARDWSSKRSRRVSCVY